MKIRLALLAALSVGAVASAQFDVNYSPSPTAFSAGFDGTTHVKAQTFTVGTGGVLARVDVLMANNGYSIPVYWDLRAMNGAVPVSANSAALASGSLDALSLPGSATFYTFDLSSFGIVVAPGDVYAFVLRGPEGNGNTAGGVYGTTNDGYAGGQFYQGSLSSGSISWGAISGWDIGLRTVVVPEPATAALAAALAALAATAFVRRRRGA